MLKAAFFTLGCRLNQTESAIMAKGLEDIGYEIIQEQNNADLCVINTCTVTNQSDAKCRRRIRTIRKNNPTAIIAVVGCFSQISSQQILEMGGVHLILGNQEKLNLHKYVSQINSAETPLVRVDKISKAPFTVETLGQHLDSTRANLKVQDGCDFFCSYCIIPFARGRSRPRELEDIRKETQELARMGVKEIILTGVNLGTYFYQGTDFLTLLDLFEEVEGIERVRISSIEPTTVGTEIFRLMKSDSSKVLPYLHLPLQSATDAILKKMRRRYSYQEYLDYVLQAVEEVPEICIGSDVIVGFPGESDALFEETYHALETSPIDYFHVFPYAERQGTASVTMNAKTPENVINRRARLLRDLSTRKKKAFARKFHHKQVSVLFEQETRPGQWEGYSENYIRVSTTSEEPLKNQIRQVLLTSFVDDAAHGRLIPAKKRKE